MKRKTPEQLAALQRSLEYLELIAELLTNAGETRLAIAATANRSKVEDVLRREAAISAYVTQ